MEYGSFQAEEFGDLQRLVDGLFYDRHAIDRLDLIVQAEILDLAPDLMEIVNLLPPGYYDRQSLCDQLNSALAAHGWGAGWRAQTWCKSVPRSVAASPDVTPS